MGYVTDNLLKNERVIYDAHLHWTAIFSGKSLALAAVGVALGASVPLFGESSVGLYAGLGAVGLLGTVLASGFVQRAGSEFAVTNRRVLIKVGLVRRRTLELNLSKIESVEVEQTVAGRLLGYGQIEVIGTGGTREAFDRVSSPLAFRKAVHEAAEAAQEITRSVGEVATDQDPVQRLANAKAMLERGLISQAEFDAIKQRLLGSL